MFEITRINDRRVSVSTPSGTWYVDRFCDGGDYPRWPIVKQFHLCCFGGFFATVDDAVDYLRGLDYSEPTAQELDAARRQDDADYRRYMSQVDYVCGIRD